MRAVVISPDNTISIKELAGYEGLVEAVGGDIQLLHFGDNATSYVNEYGKIEGLPSNLLATFLCHHFDVGLLPGDVISGVMVVVGPLDDEGDLTDVMDDTIDAILTMVKAYG